MITAVVWKVEFGEDVADMLLNGPFSYPKRFRDPTVGSALGHQGEHFALPRR